MYYGTDFSETGEVSEKTKWRGVLEAHKASEVPLVVTLYLYSNKHTWELTF
jgi:hypothetical protein